MAGCSSAPVKFDRQAFVSDEFATVLVYRPERLSNALASPVLLVDGQQQAEIGTNQCLTLRVSPGEHHVSLLLEGRYQGSHDVALQTDAKQIYFLRLESAVKFKQNQSYERRFDLVQVNEDAAQFELGKCQTVEPVTFEAAQEQPAKNDNYSNEKFKNPFNH